MPYTIEELESNEYYQNLKDEEEQKYLEQRELYKTAAAIHPGSGGIPADVNSIEFPLIRVIFKDILVVPKSIDLIV